jgi:hypothetical protein
LRNIDHPDWAAPYIAQLNSGDTVSFRPHGHSMAGRVESGQLVTVAPVLDASGLAVDDIVLCAVDGVQLLHLIREMRGDGQCLIGSNRGDINGWTSAIFGRVVAVE